MEHLSVLQSNGILRSANSYILTNRERQQLIEAFNSLSSLSKNSKTVVTMTAFMPRDTFERLYKDKLLQKIKDNRDSYSGDVIQLFIDSDPTENHRYIEWLATGYLNNGIKRLEDLKSRALPALRDFILLANKNVLNRGESGKPWTDQYNINNFLGLSGSTKKGRQYPGLDSLIDSYRVQLNQIKGVKEQQLQVMKESELIFENELVRVYQPRSEEAACRLGAGTKWCTAARENNMFKHYSEKGDIKIIVPKSPEYIGEKYQFHHETEQYMDEKDKPVDPLKLFEKYKMYDEIKKLVITIMSEDDENLEKYPENPKKINLENKNLKKFPEWVFKIKNLQTLYLDDNKLTKILKLNNNSLPDLKQLNIDNNKLTEINLDNISLPNLQKLYIASNELTDINLNLSNLQQLDIEFNNLTEINLDNISLPNLQELSLYNNKLTDINLNLSNLKTLTLSNNQLSDITNLNLPSLQYLNIANNPLTEKSIKYLRSLNIKELII